jgi:hypothetical protein
MCSKEHIWTFTSVSGRANNAGAWLGRYFRKFVRCSRSLETSGSHKGSLDLYALVELWAASFAWVTVAIFAIAL